MDNSRPMTGEIQTGPGWSLVFTGSARGLASSNGVRVGPDGNLYVVSAFGSEIAKITLDSGSLEIIGTQRGGVGTPDDLTFTADGTMFVSECMDARVSAFRDGKLEPFADGISGANGIASLGERIFVNECRPSGNFWEVHRDGSKTLMAEGLELPNGMCVAPDGYAYFTLVYAGQIARIPVDGGEPEIFVEGLEVPSSVQLTNDGALMVSQGHTGEVTKIDMATKGMTTIARTRPGIDNLDMSPDGRLFLTYYIDGQVIEVLDDSGGARELAPAGLLGPYGIAVVDGILQIADGMKSATYGTDGELVVGGKYTDDGYPGFLIGLAAGPKGLYCSTTAGSVCIFDPVAVESSVVAEGFDEPRGIAVRESGHVVVADAAAGTIVEIDGSGAADVLVSGLNLPAGVAVDAEDRVWAVDEGSGELLLIERGTSRVVVESLANPQGVGAAGTTAYVVEAAAGRLVAVDVSGVTEIVATGLSVGLDDGVRTPLGGMPELLPGPIRPFAGVTTDETGRVYVSADDAGAVLAFQR